MLLLSVTLLLIWALPVIFALMFVYDVFDFGFDFDVALAVGLGFGFDVNAGFGVEFLCWY